MEARTGFRTSAISRGLLAVVALVLAALMLGAAGYLAKSLSLAISAPAAHVTAAQKATSGFGYDSGVTNGRSGPQTMDERASVQSSTNTSSQAPRSLRGGPQS